MDIFDLLPYSSPPALTAHTWRRSLTSMITRMKVSNRYMDGASGSDLHQTAVEDQPETVPSANEGTDTSFGSPGRHGVALSNRLAPVCDGPLPFPVIPTPSRDMGF